MRRQHWIHGEGREFHWMPNKLAMECNNTNDMTDTSENVLVTRVQEKEYREDNCGTNDVNQQIIHMGVV